MTVCEQTRFGRKCASLRAVFGKNRILVTGGAGFIGSNLVREVCAQGTVEVVVLDNLTTGSADDLEGCDITFVDGDIRDYETVKQAAEGCHTIFHLAASVGNARSISDPAQDADVNVIGTINVLETARRLGTRKVVYSSSAAIFGEPQALPISPEHSTNPDSPYGVSKLAGEKLCLTYSRMYGIEAICLRYFNVYGVNQRYDAYGNVIPIFIERIFKNEPLVIYGDGEQTRDFINVQDVVKANLLAAQARGLTGAFNIGSGLTITVNQLVALIQQATGRTAIVEYRQPRPGDVLHSQADIIRATAAFGFKPSINLSEGLTEYVAWYEAPHSFIHRSELQLWALPV